MKDKEEVKRMLKKLNQLVSYEFYTSACEIGSLLLSSCYNLIVKSNNIPSSLNNNWSLNMNEFSIDNISNNILSTIQQFSTITSSNHQQQLELIIDLTNTLIEIIIIYSKALIGNCEIIRAKSYLCEASTLMTFLNEGNNNKTKEDEKKLYSILESIAECCLKLEDIDGAESNLKRIPKEFKSIKIYMKLGDLYVRKGKSKEAVQCYQDVLRLEKYAIGALDKLVQLGLPEDKKNNLLEFYKNDEWVRNLLDAKYYSHNGQYEKALRSNTQLDMLIPNNIKVKLDLAECYDQLSRYEEALDLFRKCVKMDFFTDYKMSTFATLLQTTGSVVEIQTLSQRLLQNNKGSAECWLVLAIYSTSRTSLLSAIGEDESRMLAQNKDMAMKAVDKALELNKSFVLAYLWKGHLYLMSQQYAKAISIYKQAKLVSKDIRIYQGLVKAYLSNPQQFQDALNIARMAQKIHNGKFDYKPHILLGTVYSMKEDHHDQAQKEFEQAMKICKETNNLFGVEEVLLGKVELDIKRQQYDAAIETLKTQNLQQDTDIIQTKLGQIYLLQQKLEDAFQCFHKALSLNRFNELAKRELQKLEELLQPREETTEDGDYEM
ncbi:hypothetical protein ABK040_003144 [Willaertia magna]